MPFGIILDPFEIIFLYYFFQCSSLFSVVNLKWVINGFFFSFQLVIGDFGLNHEQSKAQFGLWSILAAVSVSFLKIERKI